MSDDHQHTWVLYEGAPYGETRRFRQCSECGVVGYVRVSAFRAGVSKRLRVVPYRCSSKDCKNSATTRIKGRRGPRNNIIWVCGDCSLDNQ